MGSNQAVGSGLTFCNMNAGALADRKPAAGNDQRHWPNAADETMKNGRPDPVRRAAHSAQLARYDPPWTLPMWRRNEIVVEPYTPLTMHPSP